VGRGRPEANLLGLGAKDLREILQRWPGQGLLMGEGRQQISFLVPLTKGGALLDPRSGLGHEVRVIGQPNTKRRLNRAP